jgi:hypothetical protein
VLSAALAAPGTARPSANAATDRIRGVIPVFASLFSGLRG